MKSHHYVSSSSIGYRTGRLCQLSTEDTTTNGDTQIGSDRTVTSLSQGETIETTTSLGMVEPGHYSSYSSFSYSSGATSPQQPPHAQSGMVAMDTMVEEQGQENTANTAQQQEQQPSEMKKLPHNIC